MRLLVTYLKDGENTRLLAGYSEKFSLERKNDFEPVARKDSLDAIEAFIKDSPMIFCSYFYTDISTDLDEESFVQKFSDKLFISVEQFGDDKTLAALSMGK